MSSAPWKRQPISKRSSCPYHATSTAMPAWVSRTRCIVACQVQRRPPSAGPRDMDHALRLIKQIEPDLIFRQSQWDADVSAELGSDRPARRTCLIPYETMNIVQNVPNEVTGNSAVDSPYLRRMGRVLHERPHAGHRPGPRRTRQGSQFRIAGHPKADRLRTAPPAWPVARGDSRVGDGASPGPPITASARAGSTSEPFPHGCRHARVGARRRRYRFRVPAPSHVDPLHGVAGLSDDTSRVRQLAGRVAPACRTRGRQQAAATRRYWPRRTYW